MCVLGPSGRAWGLARSIGAWELGAYRPGSIGEFTLEMVPIDRGDPGGSNRGLEMFIGCILMELCMGISWAGPVPGA